MVYNINNRKIHRFIPSPITMNVVPRTWSRTISNGKLYKTTNEMPWRIAIKKRQLNWFGQYIEHSGKISITSRSQTDNPTERTQKKRHEYL